VTRKEQKFCKEQREVERQNRRHEKALIRQDGIEAQKQVVATS
jgi:hypothetical protein